MFSGYVADGSASQAVTRHGCLWELADCISKSISVGLELEVKESTTELGYSP